MLKNCPFVCRSEINYYAVICPHRTRDTRDRESIFGEPPTLEQSLKSLHSEAKAEGWVGVLEAGAISTQRWH